MSSEENALDVEIPGEDIQHTRICHHLKQLHEHLTSVQDHIAGHDRSSTFCCSFYSPHSYWTGEEKGRFFHALAIHSRLRPDLIAEHVATKSIADICLYLDMLEDALQSSHTVSSDSGLKFVSLPRKDLPAAYGMTDDWTIFEDEMADAVVSTEPTLMQDQVPRTREAEKYDQRVALRAKKGAASAAGLGRDREGEKARNAQFQEWLKRRQSEWEVEDFLHELNDVRLRAIDSILREDEDSWSIPRDSTLGTFSRREDGQLPNGKGGAEFTERVEEDLDDTSLEATDAKGGRLTEAAVADLPADDVPLSPASRKRLRKRLYMRRKRAEKTGQTIDESMTRLKPGRKTKTPKSEIQPDGDGSGDEDKKAKHSHPSGKTLHYRIREEFDALGIDSVRLRQDGLGLFHLTNLGRLMRTYNGLHDVSEDVTSQISASVIKALEEQVVSFISQLVRRSIVSRDQEMVAKTQTKVWRFATSQKITSANVSHALSLLSEKIYDHRQHFATLLERLQIETDSDDGSIIGEEDEDTDTAESALDNDLVDNVEPSTDVPVMTPMSLNRAIFPPLIRFPISSISSTTLHSSDTLTSEHDEDLLSSDTDEELLEAELAEEEELDAHDREQEEAYERRLWQIFKPPPESAQLLLAGTKRSHRDVENDNEEGDAVQRKRKKYAPRINKKTGKAAGKVKSAPFIDDSDVE